MTIRVGIDYDEPIMPWYDLAHQVSVREGIALPEHEPTSWAPHETYGCTLDEWVAVLDKEVLSEDGGFYMTPLNPMVKVQLDRLHDSGMEIHFVTARGSFGKYGDRVKELTIEHVQREGLPHEAIHFAHQKGPVVESLGLDYMIDDSPRNWTEIRDKAPRCMTYLLNERWNQDLVVPHGLRLYSLKEYVDTILEREA